MRARRPDGPASSRKWRFSSPMIGPCGEGAELDPTLRVEAVDRLDQGDARRPAQDRRRTRPGSKSAGRVVGRDPRWASTNSSRSSRSFVSCELDELWCRSSRNSAGDAISAGRRCPAACAAKLADDRLDVLRRARPPTPRAAGWKARSSPRCREPSGWLPVTGSVDRRPPRPALIPEEPDLSRPSGNLETERHNSSTARRKSSISSTSKSAREATWPAATGPGRPGRRRPEG